MFLIFAKICAELFCHGICQAYFGSKEAILNENTKTHATVSLLYYYMVNLVLTVNELNFPWEIVSRQKVIGCHLVINK